MENPGNSRRTIQSSRGNTPDSAARESNMKAFILFCSLFLAGGISYGADPGYHVVRRLQPGGEGGWDYLTVDGQARRLYISRSTYVMVVDIDTGKTAGSINDTPGVHGIALAPELNRGFTSNGRANTATIFDLKTQNTLGRVKTGENPDAIVYDPTSQRVFTFNGRSKDATIFEALSGEVVGTVALGGKPEFAAADGKGKVYVNIEDTDEVVEIDSRKASLTKRYSLKPCKEPTGMGLDAGRHRVYSGCHNRVMTVLDTETGRVVAAVPIGAGVDGNGFDPATGLAFSANGDGTLTVVDETSPGKYEVLETVPTQRGSRTMAIDPKTHDIYLPAAEFSAPAPGAAGGTRPRPIMVKDSFSVLVIGK